MLVPGCLRTFGRQAHLAHNSLDQFLPHQDAAVGVEHKLLVPWVVHNPAPGRVLVLDVRGHYFAALEFCPVLKVAARMADKRCGACNL